MAFIRSTSTFAIDNTPPTTPTLAYSSTSATSGSITVTATSTDAAAGISGFSFDNGATWQTQNNKSFAGNVSGTVVVRDHAGNVSAGTTFSINNIDTTPPTC